MTIGVAGNYVLTCGFTSLSYQASDLAQPDGHCHRQAGTQD